MAVLGLIATLGIFLLGVYPQILGVPHDKLTTTSIIISILCLKIFMDFLMNAVHGIFVGYIRFDIDANIGAVRTSLKAVLVFSLVERFGLYGVVFATVFTDFLNNLIKIYYAKKLHKNLIFSWKLVSFNEIVELYSFSKHIVAMVIARSLSNNADPVIISYVLDISAITVFNIASRLGQMGVGLVTALVDVFQPVFIKQFSNDLHIDKVKEILYMIISINCFVSGVIFIPLSIMAPSFISLWISDKFVSAGFLVFILIFSFLAGSISRPIGGVLIARAEHQGMAKINTFGAILNILLSVLLGTVFGLLGIVVATSISFILVDALWYPLMLKKHTNIPIKPIMINFFVLVFLYIVMNHYAHYMLIENKDATWLNLFINSGIVFIITIILSWFLLLNKKARYHLTDVVKPYFFKYFKVFR